jgi:hypothetical protein
MRQYIEASRAVRDFLAFLRSEGTLGAGAAADLDAAIKVLARCVWVCGCASTCPA